MNASRVYGRRDRVMVQQVEGESVLLDIDGGEYFSLNEVGGRVWELCDGNRSLTAIAEVVSGEYDVDAATALDDARALLEGLAEAGLVVER